MKQKRHSVEEIIRIVREVDNGQNIEAECREHNMTATSYYRWKKKYTAGNAWLCTWRASSRLTIWSR